ncbi:uncharacterized protein KIAA2013 homolog isoform X2 [Daktulosphaira vitifoliae]|uniref:uncharacterized protein KIAA2013 homolog isoform X2 n=1 Tax=Daktulosphaira vitifoliae TaxID=58002 RepID=UPI0021AA7A29|nr:uncharacterized protein KIAA2013 homolog isoform X2 [Daktulosphaira vitifoliae]
MSLRDVIYRFKRTLEKIKISKKIGIVILIIISFLYYLSPYMRSSNDRNPEYDELYMKNSLLEFLSYHQEASSYYDANIRHFPLNPEEKPFKEFVGNGYIGVTLDNDSPIYIKGNRAMSIPIYWFPNVQLIFGGYSKLATVVNYKHGIAYKYEVFANKLHSCIKYYAFRALPSILIQDVEIFNPTDYPLYLRLEQKLYKNHAWSMYSTRSIKVTEYNENILVSTGISTSTSNNPIFAVSIVYTTFPNEVKISPHGIYKVRVLVSIEYMVLKQTSEFNNAKPILENKAIDQMMNALHYENIEHSQMEIWEKLWNTGFSISTSKAVDVLNGDLINATMYYVLSSVRAPTYELATSPAIHSQVSSSLSYVEGCYGAMYDTLQAQALWLKPYTMNDINKAVSLWILTLEKQGCHNLIKAGAVGVAQAMVLSFGNFRFSNQHLEFNMHPKHLHRDYYFRRLNYGNMTHINITVTVQEDNKAVISVSMDRSDKNYYACDGGCLDNPALLGPEYTTFPVKLTEPVTAILYITYDKQHMEDLRHTIHVKEVLEAPAHEHHVIALHKHGHHLGGLPTFFWVAIGFLIIVFHLFLIKLIYNEYFNPQEKFKVKYGKLAYR